MPSEPKTGSEGNFNLFKKTSIFDHSHDAQAGLVVQLTELHSHLQKLAVASQRLPAELAGSRKSLRITDKHFIYTIEVSSVI